MYASENSLLILMILNFIAGAAFLATLHWVEDKDKPVYIPLIGVAFTFATSSLICAPYVLMFAYDGLGVLIMYQEIGLFYAIMAIVEFLVGAVWIAYWLYLKLDWFEGLFGAKASSGMMP